MNRLFLLLFTFTLFGCLSNEKEDSYKRTIPLDSGSIASPSANENANVPEEEISHDAIYPDSIALKKFWEDCILPIINLDKDKLKDIVIFPLAGDWGYMAGLDKPQQELTEMDFFDNLEKIFFPDYIAKLNKLTYKDIEVYHHKNGEINLLVHVGFEKIIDGFKDESAIILRFKNVDNRWKLYVILGAS